MGEFDRAQAPRSSSLLNPGHLRTARTINTRRGQATTIWQLSGGANSVTYGVSAIARAGVYFKRATFAWGMGVALWEMAAAGYSAMTIQRRMVADLAAAHTFAAWVFSHQNAAMSFRLPDALRASEEAEDGRGNHNVLTVDQFETIWRGSVMETRSKLNRAMGAVNLDTLTAELRGRMGDRAQLHSMSRTQRLDLMRVMMAGDFDHSAQVAARVYHMSCVKDYGATARIVAARLMQDNPYRGA